MRPTYCFTLLLYGTQKALPEESERASDLGGAEGIRTPGLLVANEARYQLRHSPGSCFGVSRRRTLTRLS